MTVGAGLLTSASRDIQPLIMPVSFDLKRAGPPQASRHWWCQSPWAERDGCSVMRMF